MEMSSVTLVGEVSEILGIHKRFTFVKTVASYSPVTSVFPDIAYVSLLSRPEIHGPLLEVNLVIFFHPERSVL